jgi:threonine synthase
VKDEGRNPTGSFKARGLAVAIALAREAGGAHVGLPTAGNAGGAAAAYAAAAGIACTVAAPQGTPAACLEEVRRHGAALRVVGRHIGEAARSLQEDPPAPGWRSLATFAEPGRVEGKKTITLEICEALPEGRVDAIVFPTGGGTGVVAARKALAELEALGRRSLAARPKLIAVQGEGCAPIVQAFERGASRHTPWPDPTGPAGLRVPDPLAGPLVLQAIRETGGTAVAVARAEIGRVQAQAATLAGLAPCLEAAVALAALPLLRRRAVLSPDDRVVVVLTGDRAKDPAP